MAALAGQQGAAALEEEEVGGLLSGEGGLRRIRSRRLKNITKSLDQGFQWRFERRR